MNDEMLLGQLNKFTRRELSADEVFIFTVSLCDNEIDRDNERFSAEALHELAEKFIGVTGIFDHNPKGENQTARLFMTEVVEEDYVNSLGEKYLWLKGYAYMVRTDSNADLIREIDGGIKKEISVSCAAESQVCSVCGADRNVNACRHIKGKVYDGTRCFFTLEKITDAYEWSFVAVPAQVHAGVTKKFGGEDCSDKKRAEVEARIYRALMLKNPDGCAKKIFDSVKAKLDEAELEELCRILAAGKCCESVEEYMM